MTETENYIVEQIKKLAPEATAFDVRANVNDKSYSLEFFATIDGKKRQCYDMIDNGEIDEDDFDRTAKQIALYIRSSNEFQKGKLNKFYFSAN